MFRLIAVTLELEVTRVLNVICYIHGGLEGKRGKVASIVQIQIPAYGTVFPVFSFAIGTPTLAAAALQSRLPSSRCHTFRGQPATFRRPSLSSTVVAENHHHRQSCSSRVAAHRQPQGPPPSAFFSPILPLGDS